MTSSIAEILAKPASAGRYLSAREFTSIEGFVQNSKDRLAVAQFLSANSSELVSKAFRELIEDQPNIIDSGGSLSDHSTLAKYIEQLDILLRYITYSTVAGNDSPLRECLQDLRTKYISMGLTISLIAAAARFLASQTHERLDLLQIEDETKSLVRSCFDSIQTSLI
jgi:phycocyanin beta chain